MDRFMFGREENPDDKFMNELLNTRNVNFMAYGLGYFPTIKVGNAIFCFEHIDGIDGYLGITNVHLTNGNRVDALLGINKIINLRKPDHLNVEYILRGVLYLDLGFPVKAINDFRGFIKLFPNSPEGHYCLGLAYKKIGKNIEAITELSLAINIKPEDNKYYGQRARAYIKIGKYEEALKDLRKIVKFDLIKAKAFLSDDKNFDSTMHFKKRIESFDIEIQKNPESAEAYYQRGHEFAQDQKHEQALEDYKVALNLNPQFNMAYFYRAYSRIMVGQFVEAIHDCNKVLELTPHKHDAFVLRAYARMKIDQIEEGIHDFRNAVYTDHMFLYNCEYQAAAFKMIGQFEKAKMLTRIINWLEFKPLLDLKAQYGIDMDLKGFEAMSEYVDNIY